MASLDSQDIGSATAATLPSPAQPDSKSRRYDRQLRLWAASGQNALESSRILLVSATATATSILKNLVLPGVGHFTILDPGIVTPEDAGNNFFLEGPSSVGKSRAEEAVRLLCELNDGVEGKANTSTLEHYIANDPAYLLSFTLIITHNVSPNLVSKLSSLLWSHPTGPSLMIVRSAGFLGEFFIQYHLHTVVDSHTETPPSLRIDKPFPALLDHAMSLDFDVMDVTDHSHIPYVVILVRALQDWKITGFPNLICIRYLTFSFSQHDGALPKSYAEKQEFKATIEASRRKPDEENFDEAVAQAYRAWTSTNVPSDITSLFAISPPPPESTSPTNMLFFHLLAALRRFTERPPHTLPLSATLPDMKSDTTQYIHLQTLYRRQAEVERAGFAALIPEDVPVDKETVDEFVKNAHGLKVLRGTQFGTLDTDKEMLASAMGTTQKETMTHIGLSALAAVQSAEPSGDITLDKLSASAHTLLDGMSLDDDATEALETALGEIVRAPTAELPNTAAFLGGLVAQEAIKMITRQYVPVTGYCVVDLVGSWTGVVGS